MEFKSSEGKRTTKQKAYREAMAEEDREDETEEEEEDGGGLYGELSFVDNVSKKRGISFPNRKGSAGGVSPTCQAQNCRADLTEAKPYHRRHKVCEFHSKAPVAIVDGLRQRFCQQCSRFHELSEFDEAKRSCRRRLAGHNERRRKTAEGECSNRRV